MHRFQTRLNRLVNTLTRNPLIRFPVLVSGARVLTGRSNYLTNFQPYYEYKEQTAQYVNVNPSLDRGQSFMDAGVLYFKESAQIGGYAVGPPRRSRVCRTVSQRVRWSGGGTP